MSDRSITLAGARAWIPAAAALALVAACSSGGGEAASTSAVPSPIGASATASATTADSGGYPLPDCTGKDPAACSYDGFTPAKDGFGFANWGAPGTLNAASLVQLFGQDAVCAEVTDTSCVLYPAAVQWAQQVNEGMANGHCEGMAVVSQLLFQGYLTPQDLTPGVLSTFDLKQDDPAVAATIDLWWATQMLPAVQEAYKATHALTPTQIASELAAGLQSGKGYTVGIYSPDGGHAVTPIAVTSEAGKTIIAVYDNNYPGTVQHIIIDPAAEHWSYAAGATNPDAPTGGWEGGQGSIELTPMASRQLPSPAPFDDAAAKGVVRGSKAPVNIIATSSNPSTPLGFLLTVDGKTYDTSDASTVLPDGVTGAHLLGGQRSGKGGWLLIDRTKVTTFSAKPTGASGTPWGAKGSSDRLTMSIDQVGSPRITIREGATDKGGSGTSFSMDQTDNLRVTVDDGADAQINLANGLNGLDLTLPDGIDMNVDPNSRNGLAQIDYVDDQGNVIGTYDLDDQNDSGRVVNGVAEFDPATGEFTVTEDFAEAESLDDSPFVALDRAIDDPSAADGSGATDNASADATDNSTDNSPDGTATDNSANDSSNADNSGSDSSGGGGGNGGGGSGGGGGNGGGGGGSGGGSGGGGSGGGGDTGGGGDPGSGGDPGADPGTGE